MAAKDRAVKFLKTQLSDGNYGLTCMGSDGLPRFSHQKGHVFSGYFIARALGHDISETDRALLVTRIMSEEYKGLWGYSPPAPYVSRPHAKYIVDADDTSFAIRTFRELGLHKSSDRLIVFHRNRWSRWLVKFGLTTLLPKSLARGGFRTFASRTRASLVVDTTPTNNLQLHSEVNLNVFLALQGTDLENAIDDRMIRESQHQDGYWHSYFYPSRYYATWFALELIRDQPAFNGLRARAHNFLRASQSKDGTWGDPYETALACGALAACDETGASITEAALFFLKSQLDDGSWATDRKIWEFCETEDDVWQAFDSNRVITTSLVLCALRQVMKSFPAEPNNSVAGDE
ncbi:hypothetical protein OAL64_00180 [bacterium]|nr:hypothetical protein [bacterium]